MKAPVPSVFMTTVQAISSPKVFGRLPIFRKLDKVGTWLALLKAMDGLPMTDAEFEVFKRFTGRTVRPTLPFPVVLILAGRRSGKSFFSALKIVHGAVFKRWPEFLGKAYILCLAADKQQAGVVHGYVRDILKLPCFRGMVVRETGEEIELRNGIIIGIHTSSFRTLRGFRILMVVADEMSFWYDSETSRNPAGEVLTAVEPALGETEGQLLIPTTPYIQAGPVGEIFVRYWGKDDPEVLVWKAPTAEMNPTFRQKVIDRAMEKDAAKARSEFYAEFRDDLETFVPLELIGRAVVPGRVAVAYNPGRTYRAFCDPSELVRGGDSMTLGISHLERGKVVIDLLDEVRPPADPKATIGRFAAILKEYRVSTVVQDRVSISWIASDLRPFGISVEPCPIPKSELYGHLAVMLSKGVVEFPDSERLVGQTRGLEKRNLSGGVVKIDHGPGGHDDLVNSLAGAAWLVQARGGDAGAALAVGPSIHDMVADGGLCDDADGGVPGWNWQNILAKARARAKKEDQ